MAITADELLILIKARDEATKVFSQVSRNFATFSRDMARVGRTLTTRITLPIIGVGVGLFKMAADAVESENLFSEVMEDMADSTREWSEGLRDQLGLNDFEIRKMTSTLFLMTNAMGIQKDAALDMSKRLTELAFDMASFRNLRVEEAFEKITAGITGEAEPLKRIGILVNEASTKQALLNANLITGSEVLNDQQKIMGRYLAILQQTTKDTGDLARTLESPTNQLRLLISDFKLAAITLGTELMPEFRKLLELGKEVLEWLKDAVKSFASLSREEQESKVKLVLLVAALGPLLMILGSLIPVVIGVGKAFLFAAEMVTLFQIATAPEKLLIAGTIALFALLVIEILAIAKAALDAEKALNRQFKAQEDAMRSGIALADTWNAKIQGLKDTNSEMFNEFKVLKEQLMNQGVDPIRAVALAWSMLDINARLAAEGVEEAGEEIAGVVPKLESLKGIAEALEPIMLSYSIAQQIASKAMRQAKADAQELKDALREQGTEYDDLAARIRAAIETSEEEFERLREAAAAAFGADAISEPEFQAYVKFLQDQMADTGAKVASSAEDAGKEAGRALISGLITGADSKDLQDKLLRILEDLLLTKVFTLLGIASPSRVYENIGKNMMLGLQKGINTNLNLVTPNLGMAVGVGVGGGGSTAPASAFPSAPAPVTQAQAAGRTLVIERLEINTGFASKGAEQDAVRELRRIESEMS